MTVAQLITATLEHDENMTKGGEIAIADPSMDPLEWFREHLSYGSGEVWCVHHPSDPRSVGHPKGPDHAVVSAITGNGPTSKVNAEGYIHHRTAAPILARMLRRAMDGLENIAFDDRNPNQLAGIACRALADLAAMSEGLPEST